MLRWTAFILALGLSATLSAQEPARVEPALQEVQDVAGLPRVLLIGDSISIGYTIPVRQRLQGKANVHRVLTNGGPTTNGLAHLEEWLGQGQWSVIHFNWGLHDLKVNDDGTRQVPLESYQQNLRELVARLKRTGARLIFASTTPVPEGKLNPPRISADVIGYNLAAKTVMQENGIPIDDLYSLAFARMKDIQLPQNVHYTLEGYSVLAGQVAESILRELEK